MLRVSVTAVLLAAAVLSPGSPAPAADRPPACRPAIKQLSVPAQLHAGDRVTGRVTLTCAPRRKTRITLSSNQETLIVPQSVVVPAGRKVVSVPVRATTDYGPAYQARVTARYAGRAVRDTVKVSPGLREVGISDSSDPNDVSLYVYFTGDLDPGVTVRLASDTPAVRVPRMASFANGHGGYVSGIQVLPVTKDTRVTVSVTLGRRTLRTSKVLLAPYDGSQPVYLRTQEDGDLYGQMYSQPVDLRLTHPAPDDGLSVSIAVQDGDPAVLLDTPTTDHLFAGDMGTQFQLNTGEVTQTRHVVLEATISGEGLEAVTVELPLTIHPRITAVDLPDTAPGGTPFTGTVTLAGPSEVDSVVYLQQSWGILDVPQSVTIPAGETSATFEAVSVEVDEPSDVFVEAYLGRTQFQSEYVTITP